MKKVILPLLFPWIVMPCWADPQEAATPESGTKKGAESIVDRINADLKEQGLIDDQYLANKDPKYAFSDTDIAQNLAYEANKACDGNDKDANCAQPAGEAPVKRATYQPDNTAAAIAKMQRAVWDNIGHPSDRTELAVGLETDVEALFPSSGSYAVPQQEAGTADAPPPNESAKQ